jgi:hypothetical protein
MTRILPSSAGLVLVVTLAGASAAPFVPPSEMPGRERDRFTESPVEKFMRSGPYTPQVIAPTFKPDCGSHPSGHSKRATKRKTC